MALRTPEQYFQSLRDGRTVYYRGERVSDVTTHAEIGTATRHAAIDFKVAEDLRFRELAAVTDAAGHVYSRYFYPPQNSDDLLLRSRLIELSTTLGKTLVILVKEIGSDALFALTEIAAQVDRRAETRYSERVREFLQECRDNDYALAVAQTDAKGDRSLGPAAQSNPDVYLRIVRRTEDGIVVRGAKMHTSCAANVNQIIVLPTRAMGQDEADYAVAFAVPVETPGLKLIASPYGGGAKDPFEHPLSAEHRMNETTTIFEDVFVPWKRVFLAGEWEWAGPLAVKFVDFHRFTAISYKLPLVDALVGAAIVVADANGVSRAAHVRDKIVRLIAYAETLRALIELTARRAQVIEGIATPDPMTVNMAKYHFAHGYHEALRDVQDCAGGSLVTSPGIEDWESPETGDLLRHFLGGRDGWTAEQRARVLNVDSDLTASDFAGYHAVLAVHAEGSLEAEKLQLYRTYPPDRTVRLARWLAGLEAEIDYPGELRTNSDLSGS